MTRQGSLAYYLAAWVCGCTFRGILIWAANLFFGSLRQAAGVFFIVICLSLMSGAAGSLLLGFVLRRVANAMHWSRPWHWLAGGAILLPALTALFGEIASWPAFQGNGWCARLSFFLSGPSLMGGGRAAVLLLAVPAGAATAWVLCCVHRAFAAPPLP